MRRFAGNIHSAAPVIIAVLAAGAAVRLIGLDHGRPRHIFHPDVAKQARAARAFYRGGFQMSSFYGDDYRLNAYPYGTSYLTSLLVKAKSFAKPGGRDYGARNLWWWAYQMRKTGVILLLAGVAAAMIVFRNALGPRSLLAAGLALVLEPLNSQFSHYGTNDAPLCGALLMCWAAAAAMCSEKTCRPVFSFLSGLSAGLCFGIKYGILAALFPAIAWLFLLRAKGVKWAACSAIAVVAGCAAGIALTCRFLVTEPREFLAQFREFMGWQTDIMDTDIPLLKQIALNAAWTLKFAATRWFWIFVPGLIWGASLARRREEPVFTRIAAATAVAYCAATALVLLAGRELVRETDFIQVFPFAVLLSGLMLSRLLSAETSNGTAPRRRAGLAAAAVICVFAYISVSDSIALTRPDTRERARDWCVENIPTGATVLAERYVLPVAKAGVEESSERYLSSTAGGIGIQRAGFDYLISSSLAHDRFMDLFSPYYDKTASEFYERIEREYRPVAKFKDRKMLFAHPDITVYERRDRSTETNGDAR